MSPHLKDLIIKLHKKGLCEAEIYQKLQSTKKVTEHIMPHMIFEVLNEYRTGMHIMNKPEGWGLFTRFWGIIVLAIGLYALVSSPLGKDLIYRHFGSYISSYEMPQPKARSHTPSGRGLAAIFLNNYTLGGTLTVIGCILIFKPHKGSQRLDL